MYAFQDEVGEGGLKHLQWYFGAESQVRFNGLQKHYPGVHFEVARSPSHSYNYCLKEDSRDPDGLHESSELSPASPAGNCGGGGSKYAELLRRIREDATLDDLEREFPGIVFGRRNDVLSALARQRAVRQLAHEKQYFREHGRLPTQRAKCQILWGPPGGGKSTIIKGRALQLADEHGLRIYQLRDGKWFQDYQGEEIIIINDMSPFRFDQSWMLDLMDGHNVWFPCKGGGFYGDIDYVFIDSNYDPDCWYAKKLDAPTPQELERAAAMPERSNGANPAPPENTSRPVMTTCSVSSSSSAMRPLPCPQVQVPGDSRPDQRADPQPHADGHEPMPLAFADHGGVRPCARARACSAA